MHLHSLYNPESINNGGNVMKKIVVLFITCVLVTGCSIISKKEALENMPITQEDKTEEQIKIDEIETVEEIPALEDMTVNVMNVGEEEKLEPVEVTIKTLESNYTDNNGMVVSHVKIDYPIIKATIESDAVTKVNEFFQDTAMALYEENNTYATDQVEEIKEEGVTDSNSTDNFFSEYQVSFEVKYNANGLLSILQSFSEQYAGKEDSNSYSTGYVFDMKTGERLTIDDVLSGTEQEIATIIGQAFLDSDEIEERIKNYYQEELMSNTQYVEFYIDNNNINFFYNPNMAVPYDEGMIGTTIPLSTENIFKINLNKIS
jgi:uncharacterized protein YceK